MGVIILHKGYIVFEHYPGQKHNDKTIYWSVTKVFVSALIGILEDRGNINVNLPLVHYLPEVRKSHYALITIRNLLDMATGLDCPENYVDKNSHYYKYSVTVGDGFSEDTSPENPYKFLSDLQPKIIHPQGEFYQYSGVNTFFLSWVIEKLTNMSFHDALSVEIWSKIGAESNASLLASSHGIANTHGGLISTLRDVARFGLLFSPSYKTVSGEKLISDRVLELISNGGNLKLWTKPREANQLPADFSHSIYQWDAIYNNGDFYKGGWAGQGLLVNPKKDLVAVYSGYSIDAEQSQPSLLPILRKVLNQFFPIRSSPDQD
jgi:CubicO group peptidase (beta-lactamase class C family)